MKVRSHLTGREIEIADPKVEKPVDLQQQLADLRVELATVSAQYEACEAALEQERMRVAALEADLAAERAKPMPIMPAPQFNVPPAPPAQVVFRDGAQPGFEVIVTKRDADDRIERLSIIPKASA